MTLLTHQYIREAFHELCATFEVRFNNGDYDSIEVIGMKKPTWAAVLAVADRFLFENLKVTLKARSKALELKARVDIVGDSSPVLVAHWNNQKVIAEKILSSKKPRVNPHSTTEPSLEEIEAFQAEIDLRGLKETLEEFSQRVLDNSSQYTLKNCKITGAYKKIILAIEGSKTKEDLLSSFNDFEKLLTSLSIV